jgi:hypothetical protein
MQTMQSNLFYCRITLHVSGVTALIQTFHQKGNLIPEQNRGEQNPLFQLGVLKTVTATPGTGHTVEYED